MHTFNFLCVFVGVKRAISDSFWLIRGDSIQMIHIYIQNTRNYFLYHLIFKPLPNNSKKSKISKLSLLKIFSNFDILRGKKMTYSIK